MPETTMSELTDTQLDALDRLIAEATPGPWAYVRGAIVGGPHGYDDVLRGGQVDCMSYCYGGTSTIDGDHLDDDMELITASRDALPALIAEVRRLRAAIAAADALHKPHDCGCMGGGLCEACDSLTWPCETRRALHPEATDAN